MLRSKTHCRNGHDLTINPRKTNGRCLLCDRVKDHRRRSANPEKFRKKCKIWRAKNPDYEINKYAKNPLPKRLSAARYKAKYPERAAQAVRNWGARNLERKAFCARRWRIENPERAAELDRRKRRNNPEKYRHLDVQKRARRKAAEGSFTLNEWLAVVKKFGGRCPRCGVACPVPTVDHIIPTALGGTNYIWNIQPLCYTCNSSKGHRVLVCYLPWPKEEKPELHVFYPHAARYARASGRPVHSDGRQQPGRGVAGQLSFWS